MHCQSGSRPYPKIHLLQTNQARTVLKSSSQKERVFQYDDRRYIDRGQLYVLQIILAILTQGVEEMNCEKVGRPFVFSNTCFAAAFLFRNATNVRYRQLQGLAEIIVGRESAPRVLCILEEDDRAWLHF